MVSTAHQQHILPCECAMHVKIMGAQSRCEHKVVVVEFTIVVVAALAESGIGLTHAQSNGQSWISRICPNVLLFAPTIPLFSHSRVHLARTLVHARRSAPFETPVTPLLVKNQQAIINEQKQSLAKCPCTRARHRSAREDLGTATRPRALAATVFLHACAS